MRAGVTTYGGEVVLGGLRTVQHWQLHVDGRFIAETSLPQDADLFWQIAEIINQATRPSGRSSMSETDRPQEPNRPSSSSSRQPL